MAAKDIPCGGGKIIPKGSIWDWRKAEVDEVRVERLFNTGWLRHTDTAPKRSVRKAEKARAARGRAAAVPAVVTKPVKVKGRVAEDEDTRAPRRAPADNFTEVL